MASNQSILQADSEAQASRVRVSSKLMVARVRMNAYFQNGVDWHHEEPDEETKAHKVRSLLEAKGGQEAWTILDPLQEKTKDDHVGRIYESWLQKVALLPVAELMRQDWYNLIAMLLMLS